MVNYGIAKLAQIGTQVSWVTILAGVNSATYDLIWQFGATTIQGLPQTLSQIGWTTTTDFEFGTLGPCAWSLSVQHKATLALTEVATGSIFLETFEYQTQRLTAEAAESAILKIVSGGGNQTISIKGRSSSKYGLADLQAQASRARNQMNRLINGSGGCQILVNFGG